MAVLTTKAREQIKPSNFALPKKNGYPIEDRGHAKAALSRISQFGTPAEQAQVRSKVAQKYPGMEVSKNGKNGGKNGKNGKNGNSRNGNGGKSNGRLASELTNRLAARDRY